MNIYIHIPFCNQKCTYCKFALTPVFDEFKKKKYLHFLEKEIQEKIWENFTKNIDTIYFGGGTPSILKAEEIKNILKIFPEWKKEISFECNPEDISENFLKNILPLGINRLSIGIQSLNDNTLKTVERKPKNTILEALENLQKFQIDENIIFEEEIISVNVDFILGLPHTKKWEILENIKFLHQNFPFITHTSVYILEKWKYPESWQEHSISDENMYDDFLQICEFFDKKWWNHYEVSNFCRPNFECKHNSWYWNHTETLWFGLSASGLEIIPEWKFSYKRTTNALSFSDYYKWKKYEEEWLTEEQIELEKFLFGIRTNGYKTTEKTNFLNTNEIEKFLQKWFLKGNLQNFYISEKWIPLIDHIIEKILK